MPGMVWMYPPEFMCWQFNPPCTWGWDLRSPEWNGLIPIIKGVCFPVSQFRVLHAWAAEFLPCGRCTNKVPPWEQRGDLLQISSPLEPCLKVDAWLPSLYKLSSSTYSITNHSFRLRCNQKVRVYITDRLLVVSVNSLLHTISFSPIFAVSQNCSCREFGAT